MSGKRRIKDSDGATNTMMCYVPSSLKKAFDDMCESRGFPSRSDRIRELMERDLASWSGKTDALGLSQKEYEDKEREYIKVRDEEEKVSKDLQREDLANHHSAFEELYGLAMSFGSNHELTKNTEKVLEGLHKYVYTGDEAFSKPQLHMFIVYYEKVLRRRNLEEELDAHRKNGFHRTEVTATATVQA